MQMVDQLHVSDRVLQHILLKQLKPTFKHVMSPNCYHLHGPTGVKYATQRIRQIIKEKNPQYILRIDIKSFYKSICHFRLIADIKKIYHDPKIQHMLENIIRNPIETPKGFKNSDNGIALRGPLSQFFSGIYLRPLDEAFRNCDVDYLRYQDDVIILCKTQRQLKRCNQKLLAVLQERGLSLSRKKSRKGHINSGFHFLGIHYLPTRPEEYINRTHVNDDLISNTDHVLSDQGGVRRFLSIKYMNRCAQFLMQEHCARHGSRLSVWSPIVSLTSRSETICTDFSCGGQEQLIPGNTTYCCNNL